MNTITKRGIEKAERVCQMLDEHPDLWFAYRDSITGALARAKETIRRLQDGREKLYGSRGDKKVTIRALQMRWKKHLWDTRPHVCVRCGRELTWSIHRAHHIVEVANGGEFTEENMEVCCVNCHLNGHGGLYTKE